MGLNQLTFMSISYLFQCLICTNFQFNSVNYFNIITIIAMLYYSYQMNIYLLMYTVFTFARLALLRMGLKIGI